MTITEFGAGNGCICSSRSSMKRVKSSVLNDPLTIMHSIIPSRVIAGNMEYLSFRVSTAHYKTMRLTVFLSQRIVSYRHEALREPMLCFADMSVDHTHFHPQTQVVPACSWLLW